MLFIAYRMNMYLIYKLNIWSRSASECVYSPESALFPIPFCFFIPGMPRYDTLTKP